MKKEDCVMFKENTAKDILEQKKLPCTFNVKVPGEIESLSQLFFDRTSNNTFAITDQNGDWVREKASDADVRKMLQRVSNGEGQKLQKTLSVGLIFAQ
jgi:hypothetical protein